MNENCKLAFEDVLSLRIEHGLKLLELEKQSHPENLMPLVIENYADFLQVFITEEQKELDKLNFHKKDRIEAIESVKEVTAYKKWALATIYLQSAF
ncbi:MAG: hypothetical protein Q8T08_19625, partial [Ignavibacteria bacterium]|nr:hypothetical protein [Ignavibacteria bacterium]